jgi:hypothetical protein
MTILKQIKTTAKLATPLLDRAFVVINDNQLAIVEKFEQVKTLENSAQGKELEYFNDAFSALHFMSVWSKDAG